MKKLLFLLMLTFSLGIVAHAQEGKDKVKKTSTAHQKVHNTLSRHKHYKGYKTKHKHHGVTNKHKVDNMHHDVKDKVKK